MSSAPIEAESVHRNKLVMGLAGLPFLLTLLVIVGPLVGVPVLALGAFHGLVFGGALTLWAWRKNPWPSLVKEQVRVNDEALEVGDRSFSRSELRGGYLVPRGGPTVRVQLRRGALAPDLELVVPDEETGLALLGRLGFGADQAVARFRGLSRTYTSTARVFATMLGVFFSAAMIAGLAASVTGPAGAPVTMVMGVATVFALLLAPAQVEVGTDGVVVSWLGRSRFLSHAEIESVRASMEGVGKNQRSLVRLTLTSGKTFKIPARMAAHDNGYGAALAMRIEQAGDVYRSGRSGHAAILARGELSFVEWVKALRAGPLGGHRDVQVSPELLWRKVEDPAGTALERAAAAVALTASQGASARLERAAETTVAPKLRVVLDAVREDANDEALAEVLEALEAQEASG